MALEPKIRFIINEDCKTLQPEDITGVYHVDSNPGGYGAPNPGHGGDAITGVEIELTFPDGNTHTWTSDWEPEPDPYGEGPLPELSMADFGGAAGDPFPMGEYSGVYRVLVAGDPDTYEYEFTTVFTCQLAGCIRAAVRDYFADKKCDDCPPRDERLIDLLSMTVEYDAIITALQHGETGQWILDAIDELYRKCSKDCADC